MKTKSTKIDRGNAERAAEHFCLVNLGCSHTRRAIKAKFFKVDFFAADVMGIRGDGTKCFVQATAGQDSAVSVRRKKLETYPWHPSDMVMVVQLRFTPDPANRRKLLYHFRISQFISIGANGYDREWQNWDKAILVPREWFKPARPAEE